MADCGSHWWHMCIVECERAVGVQDTGEKKENPQTISFTFGNLRYFLMSLTTYDQLSSVMVAWVKGWRPSRFFFQKFNTFFSNTLRTFELFEPF